MYEIDDVKDFYVEDMKDKKSTNRSSRSYSKRRKGRVHLEHDNLTDAQLNSLHGEVKTYHIGNPMRLDKFVSLPDDIQGLYIKRLREIYGATNDAIADMLGLFKVDFEEYLKSKNINIGYYGKNVFDEESWEKFLRSSN